MNFEINKPIVVPENPFWHVFKRFGRDELIAFIVNFVGTFAASYFIFSALYLSLVGPAIEKIGFFPGHLFEAWRTYRTTPPKMRLSIGAYFSGAVRGGSLSLAEDICVHDPLYIALFLLLAAYPGIPIWLTISFSFFTAVVIVAVLEVMVNETRFILLKRKLRKSGFEGESFWESRFLIGREIDMEKLTSKFASEFKTISSVETHRYTDLYFGNNFPGFSGRTPLLRLRKRTTGKSDEWWIEKYPWIMENKKANSIQLIYTRSTEKYAEENDQFRFFPVKKDKFAVMLCQEKLEDIDDIRNAEVKQIIKKHSEKFIKQVAFDRTVLSGRGSEIMITIDAPSRKNFYIIEIKVWRDIELLTFAMRFAMSEFPVVQTTHAKLDLNF